jgi:hypothetical protein
LKLLITYNGLRHGLFTFNTIYDYTFKTQSMTNGWCIDTTPYHFTHKSPLDDDSFPNSLSNNQHTFNISKYYKQQFHFIPVLETYDIVIWMDGTIEITDQHVTKYLLEIIPDFKIITWMHESRNGILKHEVDASNFPRYTSTFWNNQSQPYQDVFNQYNEYMKDGFQEGIFRNHEKVVNPFNRENVGVWLTCFIAFLKTDPTVVDFLNLWYLQTLQYTTQDQIGFPYVCFKTGIVPYTFPDHRFHGTHPHDKTDMYIKYHHGY